MIKQGRWDKSRKKEKTTWANHNARNREMREWKDQRQYYCSEEKRMGRIIEKMGHEK